MDEKKTFNQRAYAQYLRRIEDEHDKKVLELKNGLRRAISEGATKALWDEKSKALDAEEDLIVTPLRVALDRVEELLRTRRAERLDPLRAASKAEAERIAAEYDIKGKIEEANNERDAAVREARKKATR